VTGPTNAELRRWQRDAYRALGDLLEQDLPAIDWRIGVYRSLAGYVATGGRFSRASITDAWQAWADYLGAEPWENQPDGELRTKVAKWGPHDVDIVIIASFALTPDDEAP
jgi:hypothetical protein